jgi:uncharacterized protein YkwD
MRATFTFLVDNGFRSVRSKFLRLSVLGSFLLGTYGVLSARPAPQWPGPNENPAPGAITVPPELPNVYRSGILAAGPSFEEQVVELVNQERWTNGALPPLKKNALLDNSSETHSSNMATRNFFAHCDVDTGTLPWDRMEAAGYVNWTNAAENIAAGSPTPTAVMSVWMGSSGHRGNILSTNTREIGVGYVNDPTDTANVRRDDNIDCIADSFGNGPYLRYWTQNFGRRSDVYPVVINREGYETSSPNVSLYVYGPASAQEMRFKNETGVFSAWEPYNPNKAWTLSSGAGLKEVFADVRGPSGTFGASDTIRLTAPAPPADFYTVDPCRVIDTRGTNTPALVALNDRTFTIAGVCNIPATAKAISVNVAVTGATAAGNLRLHAGGTSVPLISTINYQAGQTRSNNAVVRLNTSGELSVYVQGSGTVHFILDVNGYFE